MGTSQRREPDQLRLVRGRTGRFASFAHPGVSSGLSFGQGPEQ
jgi:hypothetical protein